MSDTERLHLIEHYKWNIARTYGGWRVHSNIAAVDVIEPTLREAIDAALAAQIKWSLGR